MAIEINGLNQAAAAKRVDNEAAPAVQREQPGIAEGEKNRPSPTDAISLTDISSRLQEVEKKVAALPVIDTQRVEQIKKSLADGSYEINSARVAEKLLNFESLLDTK
jgi:negative regulator of flagellin synthesis FlgM